MSASSLVPLIASFGHIVKLASITMAYSFLSMAALSLHLYATAFEQNMHFVTFFILALSCTLNVLCSIKRNSLIDKLY